MSYTLAFSMQKCRVLNVITQNYCDINTSIIMCNKYQTA